LALCANDRCEGPSKRLASDKKAFLRFLEKSAAQRGV
jgi:hypothetical protein